MDQKNIVFFDETCPFCLFFIAWTLKRDKKKTLFFAPLSGITRKNLLEELPACYQNTLLFVEVNKNRSLSVQVRAKAILSVLRKLGGIYRFVSYLLKCVPGKTALYKLIAKHRNKLRFQKESSISKERLLP